MASLSSLLAIEVRSVTKAKCACFCCLVVDGYLSFDCTAAAFKKLQMHEAGICLDISDDRRSGCLVSRHHVRECVLVVRVPSSIDACRNTPTIRAYKAAACEVSFCTSSEATAAAHDRYSYFQLGLRAKLS